MEANEMGFLQLVTHYKTFLAQFLLKKATFFIRSDVLVVFIQKYIFVGASKYINEQEILEGQRKYFSQVML